MPKQRDKAPIEDAHVPTLYLKRTPPLRLFMRRGGLAFAATMSAVMIFWLERDSLRDLDGHVSFIDVVYFTAVTLSTIGYGDIVPISDRARLLDALVVTPIRLFIWLIFLATAYELFWQRLIEEWRMNQMQKRLVDHIIVCGFGYSGSSAARMLGATEKERQKIVVIEREQDKLEEAAASGFIGVRGDCTRDVVLHKAGIHTASAILFCVRSDEVAALATLTARNLNADVRILAMVKDQENLRLLKRAGAQEVIAPSRLAGHLMADAVRSRYTTRFVNDLLAAEGGFLRITERIASAAEVGRAWRDMPGMLVVAVERAGEIVGFWEPGDQRIQEGDLIFAIEANPSSAKVEVAPPL